MRKTVADAISSEPSDQLEAIAIVVVDYDGANPAKLITDLPAPQRSG
jgi:hypothetical protein